MSILLLFPPVAKICEPPAGIARLAGALRERRIDCVTIDLNLDCMLDLIATGATAQDTWSRRAFKNRDHHIRDLRSSTIYHQPDRYRRAVKDLNRVVANFGRPAGLELSLANYSDPELSPLKSCDLLEAAEQYRKNPFYSNFSSRLDSLLEGSSFTFIGISFSYLSQALTGFAILGYIRAFYPTIQTVAGGGVITSWMSSSTWLNRFSGYVDHLIKGPGEQALLELMGHQPERLPGKPDYSGMDFGSYLAPGPVLPYAASDGCYWKKCTFCPDHAENSCFSQNSPDRVIDEISDLISSHKPLLLHFLDNAMSPALLTTLIEQPPGVAWYGFSRFERELENPDFCHALKKSGCVMLKLGLESGSQHVLDQMKKGISLNRAARVLGNLEKAGIATYIYLLFGTPHETEEEARMTMDFVTNHHQAVTFLNLAIFNMPVCGPNADDLKNRFSDGDLSLYCDFDHPRGWDRRSVRSFLQNCFRKVPEINTILQRDPPFFTSNHAPFFCMDDPIVNLR